ncbi:hypothetical protein HY029_02850 [Candidatus Gottesmanbacteria bacterium]|nr:hypothetical protein [Candidatus Gottesmanbacteria bacterium]
MENTIEFKSNDFYLSACILASGIPLKRIEYGDPRSASFIFDDLENKVPQILADHWNKKLLLPTRNLIEAINELKTRLHSGV